MEYRILGPLEVLGDDGTPVTLAGVRERTLLATLLLSVNHVVSTDRLIDVLWGEAPPPSAVNALQVYVSKLRTKLESASSGTPIRTEHHGYVLMILPSELDAARFEELVRSSEATGPEEAVARLTEALSLWRGEVLSGLAPEVSRTDSARLEELRLVAIERRVEAELSLGHHHEIVAELESVASEHLLRERLQGQLMVALYRCGRQADALAVYRRTRTTLAEELGIDPSKPLQDLELAILNQAPEITAPTRPASSVAASVVTAPALETLTFLFTDIEGSTEKLARLRDAYTELLTAHHEIIRASLAAHQGKEISTAGDGFFAVFTSPSTCISAVIEMQQALVSYQWPAGEEIRVRMAVHTGEALETGIAGLVGLEVNRAARIAAVGHGGQVLVSSTAAALLRDSLPDGAYLLDLGSHRLRDLSHPEQIFQLEAEGLPAKFPLLRSLDNPELSNNLPVQLTSFIGRELELDSIRALVRQSRLVTLTGAGGVGKTRLALQAAAELVDGSGNGVWFVDLAPLSDPDLVVASIALAVGVSEERGRPLSETLIDALRDSNLLVVLDNCEHVIDACAKLADALLRSCPRVHILATSREPLAIGGERVYRVPSLTLPTETADDDVAKTAESDALRLFADRAKEHRPDFVLNGANIATVVSVCRRLDGIPLAIELAAARLRSMAVADVEARLDQRFRLLTGGDRMAVPRQQTLRAMVDWSYELLPNRERALLRKISVFAGGWLLDAAEAVCRRDDIESWEVVDLLGSLVDKSLVQADPTGDTLRYRMLETIRQYAAEQFSLCDDAEIASVRQKHAEVFLAMAEAAVPHIRGALQQEWLARLDQEQDNLRTAFMYFIETPSAIEKALRLGIALEDFWMTRGLYGEGAELVEAALSTDEGARSTAVRSAALKTAGELLLRRDGPRAASARFGEGLAIAQRLGDQGLASDHLQQISWVRFTQGDHAGAFELVDEGLRRARDSGDARRIKGLLRRRATIVLTEDPDQARADLQEVLGIGGNNKMQLAGVLSDLGLADLAGGNLDVARASLEEARDTYLELHDDEGVVVALENLCLTALGQDDLMAAVRFSTDALTRCRLLGKSRLLSYCILSAALCATALGEHVHAAKLHGAADAIVTQRDEVFQPTEAGLRERDHISLRQSMGDSEFVAAYESGHSLSPTDATGLALEIMRGATE